METIGYHGTKADFDAFESGTFSIDRMVGPHFSKTPALANKFALRSPGRKGQGKRTGGRVIPVRLAGEIYKLNQHFVDFPGATCMLSHPETGGHVAFVGADYHALAHDIGKVALTERPDLLARYAAIRGHDSPQACLEMMTSSKDWPRVSMLKAEGAELQLMTDIAQAYRNILVARGYGVIEYVNTAKKEQVGDLADQTCYIALTQPRFFFE